MLDSISLKKKLRDLKKQEIRIRFPNGLPDPPPRLIWDDFFIPISNFSGDNEERSTGKLQKLTSQERKRVFDEFFVRVYVTFFEENGLFQNEFYKPDLLDLFDLPADADLSAIKRRFRELAKEFHPDRGGDPAKMRELLEVYHSLTSGKS